LNKYIKCNFGGLRCGTSTIVDIRRLKVKTSVIGQIGEEMRFVLLKNSRLSVDKIVCAVFFFVLFRLRIFILI